MNPAARLPAGACDCHVHVVGPQDSHPMLADRHYTPPPASLEQLRAHLAALGAARAVIVQPSFYGTDNGLLCDSLEALAGAGRGVAVLDPGIDDAALARLHALGVRGLRVNLESVGASSAAGVTAALQAWAGRLRGGGWHLQVYASHGAIAQAAPDLRRLGLPVVLDHFAMMPPDLSAAEAAPILDLVGSGAAYVKLSAAYRIGGDAAAVTALARRLVALRPDRMLWASDWPHTNRTPGAAPTDVSPYREIAAGSLLAQATDWLPDPATRRQVLVDNPAALYGF
ncbi:amidohydrolase family protein [Bordetella genomosp. 1]|uniref:amidohydrolase family protein n=1 Tax=Bordetella genomosp. 1 TaxID=1395607 RepID=UPI00211AE806|nr:amidohydrolase family protein [Bordetella genomosp. 1]